MASYSLRLLTHAGYPLHYWATADKKTNFFMKKKI
jgi:hypothetical protein